MTDNSEVTLTIPVGRLVQGSVHKGNTKDPTGQPLVVKTGPNAGQPRTEYYFAVAVPKQPGETSWSQTAWGQQIVAAAQAAWPQGQWQNAAFAWKIEDGDSQVPNKRGRTNAATEGFAGNWIVKFSSGYAPQIVNRDGTQKILEDDVIKRGYFVEVLLSVKGNANTQTPGMYVSPKAVAFTAYGEEIKSAEIDTSNVGFGQSALPAGAQTTPPAALGNVASSATPPVAAPAPAAAVAPGPVPAPTLPQAAPAPITPVAVPAAPPAAAPPVAAPAPNPAILQAPPATPVAKQLTDKAQGNTYEQLIAAGWTDETLKAQGLMVA